ncbi:MAG: hypothetical protein R3C16_07950 [Hyphomonadaceae bacterium]
MASEVRIFSSVPYIVDIDDSFGEQRPRLRLAPDRAQMEYFGVSESQVLDSVAATLGGQVVGYSHRGLKAWPDQIAVRLPQSARSWSENLAAMPAGGDGGRWIALGRTGRTRIGAGEAGLIARSFAATAYATPRW